MIPKHAGAAKTRTITYLVLSESRSWTSTDGKVLEAKLIAFEDIVIEGKVEGGSQAPTKPPANPTVVRNDKVRLLAGKKSYELDLSRLSEADRSFIEQTRSRHERKPAATP